MLQVEPAPVVVIPNALTPAGLLADKTQPQEKTAMAQAAADVVCLMADLLFPSGVTKEQLLAGEPGATYFGN